jgi:AcrR family transcriptional regulator
MVRTLRTEKRDKLLTAALKLFVDQGVQNTSTADIAKEAGMAAGTLFLYFPTKQDLLDALVLEIATEQTETITALLDPDLSARGSFFVIWSSSLRWFIANLPAYQYIQQVRDTGMISAAVVQETDKAFAFYYAAIQKGLAEGSILPYPPELIGGFLYHDIVAVMNLIRMQPDPTRYDEWINQGFEILRNGIKNEAGISKGKNHEV